MSADPTTSRSCCSKSRWLSLTLEIMLNLACVRWHLAPVLSLLSHLFPLLPPLSSDAVPAAR
eukprot:358702-Rhodomonas_salina.3